MGRLIIVLLILLSGVGFPLVTEAGILPSTLPAREEAATVGNDVLRCVAFGPYVDGLDPDRGPHPSPALIDALLDVVVNQTSYHCIMTYGVLNGLDYIFQAASERGIKVIAIIWLDVNESENDASIERGIQAAKAHPDTIIRLSCGSEFRTRNGVALDHIIRNCLARLRAAGVTQPITSIDTWWEWCARSWPCRRWDLSDDVDWIGVNVFPWWENKYSGLFPCTPAAEAGDFHIARIMDVSTTYGDKQVILTEFGWPAGPDGYTETNIHTGQKCGEASEENQRLVREETLANLDRLALSGVVFEAFREGDWKRLKEGPVGVFWGVCQGAPPYTCPPGPPSGLGATPSGWTSINSFTVGWTNPSDPSGIVAAWYKLGSVPTSSTDGTRVPVAIQTISGVQTTAQGGQLISLWLEDGAGNKNHNNRSSTTLYYDATPPTGGTIAINNDAASTSSLLVTLNDMGATETMSGLSQMRFSNNNSTWSPWESYASTRNNWDLSQYGGTADPGTKTVYVQYRDGAGNQSGSFSDTITYTPPDITPPSIAHTPVGSATSNTPIGITAAITDNVGVHSATLFYRPKGASSYSAVAMTASGTTYTGTIPASVVTAVGVQYYLEARDAAGNVARTPSSVPATPYTVAVAFTDSILTPGSTLIKTVHITDLRQAINTLRSQNGLAAFAFTDATLTAGSTPMKRVHVTELRTALAEAYQTAGRTQPTYTEPTITAGQTLIRASHLSELRTAVRSLE